MPALEAVFITLVSRILVPSSTCRLYRLAESFHGGPPAARVLLARFFSLKIVWPFVHPTIDQRFLDVELYYPSSASRHRANQCFQVVESFGPTPLL